MEIYYENCENKKINLNEWPIAIEDITPLFAKKWDCELTELKTLNKSNFDQFYRTSKQIKLKVQIFADSEEEYKNLMNEFEEMTEKDILNVSPGKLWCNGYYMPSFIVVDEPQEYEENFYTIDTNIEVLSVNPFWVQETEYYFSIQENVSTNNKIYAYKYSYRYANGLNNTYIINPHFTDANFKMIIYGPVMNPQVSIGGNPYLANIILEENERLEIDSRSCTVVKVMRNGEIVSAFHNRQKKRKFFRKISPGRQNIVWTGKFAFDLILYEERSKPKW